MSELIKGGVLNFGACALLGGMMLHITPDKTQFAFRIVIVPIMLLCVLSPFKDVQLKSFEFDTPSNNTEIENYDALMHTANLTEKRLYSEMKELLINLGVNEYEIYISTTVSREESIVYLDEIKIEVGNEFSDKISEIRSRVAEEYSEILKVGVKNE